jgi:hypothetical protein
VVCNGAERAIFVRGLPEMKVKNILLEDMVFQSKQGVDMTEAGAFVLRNIQLITRNSNPVLNIHNSENILVEKIDYNNGAELLLNVSGEKTKNIVFSKTDLSRAKTKSRFSYGAKENSLQIK